MNTGAAFHTLTNQDVVGEIRSIKTPTEGPAARNVPLNVDMEYRAWLLRRQDRARKARRTAEVRGYSSASEGDQPRRLPGSSPWGPLDDD